MTCRFFERDCKPQPPGAFDCEQWPRTPYFRDQCEKLPEAVKSGKFTYDPVQAATCISVQTEQICGDFLFGDSPSPWPCNVLRGTLPLGAKCDGFFGLGDPCRDGYCRLADDCTGVCSPYVAVGEACDYHAAICDPAAAYCVNGTCRAMVPEGASCAEVPCERGLRCAQHAGDATCTQTSRAGGPCKTSDECLAPAVCIQGRCDPALPGPGEACSWTCAGDAECDFTSGESLGTCLAPLAVGEPCVSSGDGARCERNSRCAEGVCRTLPPAGQPCLDLLCTEGASCDTDRICYAPGEVGADCRSRSCRQGLVCTTLTYDADWNATQRTCREPGALGEPCDLVGPATCASGLSCARETITCQPVAVEGAVCNPKLQGSCAEGLYCACSGGPCGLTTYEPNTTDRCVAKGADGTPCEDDVQCSAGACNAGACGERPPACLLYNW